jgi:hypothetical protein
MFTCLGMFLPLMFVFPSVLLDFFRVPYFSAKYSGSVCFPTGYLSNLVFVSGPITLSIVLNTIALIRIIIYLTRNSITMSHVRKTNSFQEGHVNTNISGRNIPRQVNMHLPLSTLPSSHCTCATV